MDYESFKKKVSRDFMCYLGEGFEKYEVKEVPYEKRGKKCDGFSLMLPAVNGRSILPTLCINEMYDRYKRTGDFEGEMIKAAQVMKNGVTYGARLLPASDYTKAEGRIVYQLINTAENGSLLEEVPHRKFLDLSIVYRWAVDFSSDGVASVLVNNDLASILDMDEEDLYNAAFKNTRKLLPPVFRDIREMLGDMMTDEEEKAMLEDMPVEQKLYVVTNRYNFAGASVLLYEDILNDISTELGSDLYILPASINEVLVLTVSHDKDPDALANIVNEINECDVDESDRLSNSVYFYSASSRKIYIAAGEYCTAE